ncbi:2,3-diphosphoglycerate-dependent phosphoglycerate mutase [Enterococcus alcedinis]|uniref:2,3-bisphosphoglycerate-dependent phosphoglycerate mutase n=1 Tax=Enterococcus alcedinis TaxID=1274384 RepID=A0A917N3V3_9ENTE|nr:2,3-diphosphoglycerate-dependent phosphoglycerate mutase [Enterococcus alcedinis]MBP2101502.1 2,3-bisphosphoglycerate-dependent phosphoglycerate mutase [Enterococcus alcedinis]GGI65105.1 2,3-bisphosphoglycerate-dependent phosphoglycerate mutase [Enterococcus alcedinis]
MVKLVFARHGLSEWNKLNQFTGWVDVDLAPEGIEEAKEAGKKIKQAGIEFDIAFTSVLTRAIKTCNYILDGSDQLWVPQIKSWRLNERHYGALQGLNKQETRDKYGDEQVHIWRRSYDVLPPLSQEKPDRRYRHLAPQDIPKGENLKITLERALPFWQDEIAPALLDNKTVLVAAHGNSLRALAKHIEGISDEDIMNLEIPTGIPLVYEMDDQLNVLNKYYL